MAELRKIHYSEELQQMQVVCLNCSKGLGHITFVPRLTNWFPQDIYPLCSDCYEEKAA